MHFNNLITSGQIIVLLLISASSPLKSSANVSSRENYPLKSCEYISEIKIYIHPNRCLSHSIIAGEV